jgi:hypothetical protein
VKPRARAWLSLTLPHFYGFEPGSVEKGGSLGSAASWDMLRESDQDGSFGFGSSRAQWAQRARSHAFLAEHAACIVGLLRGWNARQLVSVGVGTAMLEYLIKSAAPDVVLRCGDFAPHSLERLRRFFPECDSIEMMDLRDPTWATDPSAVLLLNRVDTELNDLEWKEVFRRLHRSQIERIIFIPCELLTANLAFHELRGLATAVRRRRRLAHAGYIRTEGRLLELFANLYTRTRSPTAGRLPVWALTRMGNRP